MRYVLRVGNMELRYFEHGQINKFSVRSEVVLEDAGTDVEKNIKNTFFNHSGLTP